MQNILIAIDFSEITPVLITQAATLAKALNGKLWLLHVANPVPDFVGYNPVPQTDRNQVAQEFQEEHRHLQTIAEHLCQRGIEAVALLVQGSTVKTILHEANKLKADLIIIGSHGRTGISKALLGSVSEGILHQSHCPVLVIPDHLAKETTITLGTL